MTPRDRILDVLVMTYLVLGIVTFALVITTAIVHAVQGS